MQTPPGQLVRQWEAHQFDAAVEDAFGYHALQIGMPDLPTLRTNRIPHQFVSNDSPHARAQVLCDHAALPFDSASLDLVTLPHTLELSADPHATLREVERVLVPEGQVVITCFNPASLWGMAQRRGHLYRWLGWGELYLPGSGEFLAHRRLRDWLRLLSFEVEEVHFGLWRPSCRQQSWLDRSAWMEPLGQRWWPIFGALYTVHAVKRVRGMRLLGPSWKKTSRLAAAPATVAQNVPAPQSTLSNMNPSKECA